MLDENQIKTLLNKIFKLSPARSTEVIVTSIDQLMMRFANNRITQSLSEEDIRVSIRVLHDNKMGRATTNRLDDKSLSACCERALQIAKNAAVDPDALPLPGTQTYKEVDSFYEATRHATAYQITNQVEEMISVGAADLANLSGMNEIQSMSYAIGNSQGLFAYNQSTSATASVTAFIDENSGFAICNAHDIRQIDYEQLAETAVQKARLGKHPRELPPGEYTVILEPQAVANLLAFLIIDSVSQISPFSGHALLKKQGFVALHFGEQVFGTNFTLKDDVYHPEQQGIPFDGEGIPTQTVELVKEGVLSGVVHSRSSALQLGAEPTGHGLELPNPYGALPSHLVLKGGDTTLDDMIKSTRKGIVITRFWYTRLVDSNSMTITGMTRDGTFLVENGEITARIKNLRFNESLFRAFKQIQALGKPVRTLCEESGFIMVVPPLLIDGFRFTDATFF